MALNPPQFPQSSNHLQTPYEACLYGQIRGDDAFRSVFDRLTLRTENGTMRYHVREVIFQSAVHNMMAVNADEQPTLVCTKDLLNSQNIWNVSTRGRPEPARLHPLAIVRPAIHAKANGDIQGFASILGFQPKEKAGQHVKRGYLFGKGLVSIHMYQAETENLPPGKENEAIDPAIWFIEARTPPTTGQLTASIDALTDIRDMLKGLVDLDRSYYGSHV